MADVRPKQDFRKVDTGFRTKILLE